MREQRGIWASCFHLQAALLSFLVSWFVPPAFPSPWVVKFPLTSQGFQSGASLSLLSPVFHSVHSPMPGNCQGERWPPLNQLACFPLPHSSSLLPPVPVLPTRDLRLHEQIVFYRCLCKLKCDFCVTEGSMRVKKSQWQILRDKKRAWCWGTNLKNLCSSVCLIPC